MNISKNIKQSFKQTLIGFKKLLPMLIGMLLLISIIKQSYLFEYLSKSLNDSISNVIITNIIASISAGNAINSYIIADSFGNINENTLIISVFLISWVTVGLIQIPAEIYFFGKKFTIIRNSINFIFSIIGAYFIYFLMN